MILIGEALIGAGNEVAHVDLVIGNKSGPVGTAFVNGLTNLSAGHTPLIAVIKPNLPTKPSTLIVPKVTVKGMEQASQIFGPAQMGVAKAIADSVAEGVIPEDKVNDWVIIASVFIHPAAKNYRKIYQYNYGATKLSIRRALANYPPIDKILKEKDRSLHPIMGFRPNTLWNPPYLQVALDTGTIDSALKVISVLPKSERILIEIGTPLLKQGGVDNCIEKVREIKQNAYIIADMKTMDVGRAEVAIAANATADAVVVSAVAGVEVISEFVTEANKQGIHAWIDSMNVSFDDLVQLLKELKEKPRVVILHRGIDQEEAKTSPWGDLSRIKEATKDKSFVAVAGGIKPNNETFNRAMKEKVEIIIVGRYIYRSPDPYRAAQQFLDYFEADPDTMRLFDKIDY
ncbi:MAG: bifunctional 5,6,7,8-tetrahydromethanopterin hydro-lyase/3-hexulose-6-phosphate synthase [Candidatus Odinarchaeota archaeon]